MNAVLKEQINQLPNCPGVYLMKDESDLILYVGKSIHLKNRVRSYFYQSTNHSSKIKQMVSSVHHIDFITTDTEVEALLLECQLIQSHQPIYNRLMKNPKNYCYIQISNAMASSIKLVYEQKLPQAQYFGPYKNKRLISNLLEFFNTIAPIRMDGDAFDYQYHVLPQIDRIQEADKSFHVMSIVNILENPSIFLDTLLVKMKQAAEALSFYEAAFYRDGISLLKYILKYQGFNQNYLSTTFLITMEKVDEASVKVFLIKGNEILYSRKLSFKELDSIEVIEATGQAMINVLKKHRSSPTHLVNKNLVDPHMIVYDYFHKRTHQSSPYMTYSVQDGDVKDKLLELRKGFLKFLQGIDDLKNETVVE